jgi:hypothetical protein
MALGVNYGTFSGAIGASLSGVLWHESLYRKNIHVARTDFARVNSPIVAFAMAVGCAILAGEVYVVRDNSPYDS